MAIIQTACTVFKTNLLKGDEDFNTGTPYTYKIALYNANANLDADTLVYTTQNEVTGSGYTAGGEALVIIPPTSDSNVAYISFQPEVWNNASFTTRGALIYNSNTNAACFVLNFGSDKTCSNQTFTVTFPAAGASSAILRIS
jgi:hypothetical protein